MTYYQTKFSLTKNQLQKIASAVADNTEVTLRLSKDNFNVQGYNLPLTLTQINKINDGNVHDLKFSSAQIKYINNKLKKHPDVKNGGFLPLAALIPIIATVLGGLGSVARTVASTVQTSQANRENERHNKEVENQLKSGTGLKISKKKKAKGLYLNSGKGLRL
jgi:hypothetical protein